MTAGFKHFLRRFLHHRLAVVAFCIIAVYGIVALLILFGFIVNEQDVTRRYGPMHIRGFSQPSAFEQRQMQAEWWIQGIENALLKPDPQKALEDFEPIGNYRPAELKIEEFRGRVKEYYAALDGIDTQLSDGATAAEVEDELATVERDISTLFHPMTESERRDQSMALWLGTDRQGRSIFYRALYSVRIAVLVGLVTGAVSVLIGTALGMAAGLLGGWVDTVVTWLYSTLGSIPSLVLLVLLAHVFSGSVIDDFFNVWTGDRFTKLMNGARIGDTLFPVYVAFIATFWIGPCRVIRGETLKIRELEYIQAATVMGYGRLRILFRHVLPNVTYLMLINFSLLFIGAIKSEVILSFLGLGVKNVPSWGKMISQSGYEVVNGYFWQIGAATAFMLVLVLAFNILSDALQDILDPKHVV